MDDTELTDAEREQMRRLNAFRRVALGILAKWAWPLLVAFLALAAAFSAAFARRAAASPARYRASTRLLFAPRQAPTGQPLGDRQLLGVLDRDSLRRAVGDRVQMPAPERERLADDLSIEQERKPTNLFTIEAGSPDPARAVAKANAYAAALVEEYAAYRKRDLDAWGATLDERKRDLDARIAALEADEAAAKGATGVAAPAETLALLNGLVADGRRALARLSAEQAEAEARKARLAAALGGRGDAIARAAPSIRRAGDRLAALDSEIERLRAEYTDANPLLRARLADRQAVLDGCLATLRGLGLGDAGLDDVERLERAVRDLEAATREADTAAAARAPLERALADNEAKIASIVAALPALQRATAALADAGRALRELEDQRAEIRYLAATAAGDLRAIEPALEAEERSPTRPAVFAAAAAAAAALVLAAALWILALELSRGRIRGAAELGAGEDVAVLGSLPAPGAARPEAERDAARAAALAFCDWPAARGVVLLCPLPGAEEPPAFREALDWALGKSGVRTFRLRLVAGGGFAPPAGCETAAGVARRGAEGWLPVADPRALDPAEARTLRAGLAALRESFQCVFLELPAASGLASRAFDQALAAADGALLFAAAGATPRAELRLVRARAARAKKPLAGVAVGGRRAGAAAAGALALLLAAGCQSVPGPERLYGALPDLESAPPPAAAAEAAPYRIAAGDTVAIRVHGREDLSATAKVAPDGTVGLFFLGQLRVAGLSLDEAREAVERGLAGYVRGPVAAVSLVESAGGSVTVCGDVRNPGRVACGGAGIGLLDALAEAGWVLETGWTHAVVIRAGAEGRAPAKVELGAVLSGARPDVRLLPGDVVFVPHDESAGSPFAAPKRPLPALAP